MRFRGVEEPCKLPASAFDLLITMDCLRAGSKPRAPAPTPMAETMLGELKAEVTGESRLVDPMGPSACWAEVGEEDDIPAEIRSKMGCTILETSWAVKSMIWVVKIEEMRSMMAIATSAAFAEMMWSGYYLSARKYVRGAHFGVIRLL